jgi:TonB family protein
MEPGVTAPELLPSNPASILSKRCKKKVKSTIPVVIYVDAEGVPRDLSILFPNKSILDELALKTVADDRFKPGTYKNQPVPVAETVTVTLNACMDEQNGSSSQQSNPVLLCSQPQQKAIPFQQSSEIDEEARIGTIEKIGPGVSPPIMIKFVPPGIADNALREKFQGGVVVSFIVDKQGVPQNPHVMLPIGLGLDDKAIEAVKKWRFKPAMKDGEPVAVRFNYEINFSLN